MVQFCSATGRRPQGPSSLITASRDHAFSPSRGSRRAGVRTACRELNICRPLSSKCFIADPHLRIGATVSQICGLQQKIWCVRFTLPYSCNSPGVHSFADGYCMVSRCIKRRLHGAQMHVLRMGVCATKEGCQRGGRRFHLLQWPRQPGTSKNWQGRHGSWST